MEAYGTTLHVEKHAKGTGLVSKRTHVKMCNLQTNAFATN